MTDQVELGVQQSMMSVMKLSVILMVLLVDGFGVKKVFENLPFLSSKLLIFAIIDLLIICLVKYCYHDKYISLEQCPATVLITSSGLANTYHPSKLGTYSEDGISNGHISYKNLQGYYLYFSPDYKWLVSTK